MEAKLILMKKLISLFILIPLFFSCTSTQKTATATQNEETNKIEILKDYALCTCLDQYYKKLNILVKEDSRATMYDIADDYLIINNRGKKIDSMVAVSIDSTIKEEKKSEKYLNRITITYNCINIVKMLALEKLVH
jgi:preprotein translocase subunit SecG